MVVALRTLRTEEVVEVGFVAGTAMVVVVAGTESLAARTVFVVAELGTGQLAVQLAVAVFGSW